MGILGQSIWLSAILCLIFPSWFNVTKGPNNFSNQKLYLLGWWGGTISLFGFIIHSLTATGNATFFEIGWSMSLILALSLWWIVWKKMDTKLSKLMDTLSKTTEYKSTKETTPQGSVGITESNKLLSFCAHKITIIIAKEIK